MNVATVMEEIRTTLGAITGLRRPLWGVEKATPPAVIISVPRWMNYDETYGRGCDWYEDVTLILLGGPPNVPQTLRRLGPYADGSGPKSIIATLDARAGLWVACDVVHIRPAEFDVVKFANVEHLAALFHLNIIGRGA